MTPVRWSVLAEPTALGTPGAVIGQVLAPDRRTALQRARFAHGPAVGVMAELSETQAAREKLGAGRIVARTPKKKSHYRDYQAERRRQRRRTDPDES
jgi:predicted component of type VI protein secretion system